MILDVLTSVADNDVSASTSSAFISLPTSVPTPLRSDEPLIDVLPNANPKAWLYGIFLAAQIVGALGNLLVLFTVLWSRKLYRHAIWVNFCLSWLFYAAVYLVLYVFGVARGREPPSGLCLAHATVVYGSSPLCACTTLSLVIQLTASVWWPYTKDQPRSNWRTAFSVGWPYVVWAVLVANAFRVGYNDQHAVVRFDSPYCWINAGSLSRISAITDVTLVVTAIVIELSACVRLYSHWRELRTVVDSVSLPLLCRLLCFSFFALISVATCLVFIITQHPQDISNLMLSLMPFAAFLVFGTHKDIIECWAFWRSRKAYDQKPPELSTISELNFAESISKECG